VPSIIAQNSPHVLGRNPEEVSPVLPNDAPLGCKLEVCLVNKRLRIECVVEALASEVVPCETVEFRSDLADQSIHRTSVPLIVSPKQSCYRAGSPR